MDALAEIYEGVSTYVYALNNPARLIDPDGNTVTETDSSYHFTGKDAVMALHALKLMHGTSQGNSQDNQQPSPFEELWNSYPPYSNPPLHSDPSTGKKDIFSNHCAICLSEALLRSSANISTFRGINRKGMCWNCNTKDRNGKHVLRAKDLADWLVKHYTKVKGASAPIFLTGENFRDEIQDKTGIVFFEDYWQRSGESGSNRTGDHIDLWKKGTLKSIGRFLSWTRRVFPETSEQFLDMSNLAKSKTVIFWEIK